MPVITRSQSNKINSMQFVTIRQPNIPVVTNKLKTISDFTRSQSDKRDILLNWFIRTIKTYLSNSEQNIKFRQILRLERNLNTQMLNTQMLKLYYFDNIRIVDECLCVIKEYLPELSTHPKLADNKFAYGVYKKINELYKNIHYPRSEFEPETDEELQIINSMIDTLDETYNVITRILDI